MRSLRTALLLSTVLAPVLACEVHTGYGYRQPNYSANVDVQPPPQPTVNAQVDVNAQQPDPNAQQVDPNAQAADPNAQQDVQDTDSSAVNDFRDVLAPYGTWVDDPQYGTIWMPSPGVVGSDFTPYMTAGHWVYDNDYTWVSDYDWGWAPFHYGRWAQLPGRGWGWIPGKEYAGAWVTWRNGDDGYGFVGWAPTAPSYYWRGGQAVTLTTPWSQPRYTYAATTDLFAPTIRDRVIRDPARVTVIEGRTRNYAPAGRVVIGGGGARMRVRGPEPVHLGLNATTLPRAPANNPAFLRTQQFTRTHPGTHTVTPTHPPMDTHTMQQQHPEQGHTEQHPQQHVEQHPEQGHSEQHPVQQQQHVEQHEQGHTEQHPQQPVQQQHVEQHPEQGHTEQHPQQPVQQHPQQQVAPPPTNVRRPLPPPSSTTHSRR